MKCFGIIYKATNKINGKVYIGQTTQGLHKRKSKQIYDSKNKKYGGSIFLRAINKYKKENFLWEEVCKCFSREELDRKENFYINFYESNNLKLGYNLITGRGRSGYKLSKETRNKISKKAKIRLSIPENNPMYGKSISDICGIEISKKLKKYYLDKPGTFTGKHHTKEFKLKMSFSRTGPKNHFYGKNLTEEHRSKISESNKGKYVSKETCKRISESKKGKKLSEEHKQKIRDNAKVNPNYGNKGKQVSDITKEKLRQCNLGKKHSEEAKKKMSLAHKGRTDYRKGWKHTEESKEKMSKSTRGKNNPMYGVPCPHTGKFGENNHNSKKYVITTPAGDSFIVIGIHNFCNRYTEEILYHSSLIKVAKEKQKHHKGFKCRYFDEDVDSNLFVWEKS
jgi:group I intron endonuclease